MLFETNGVHSLLAIDNELWVWGSNCFGELGIGNNNYVQTPVAVDCQFDNSGIKSIKLTNCKSFVLTRAGNIFASGDNRNFQISDNNDVDKTSSVFIKNKFLKNISIFGTTDNQCIAVTKSGELYIWGKREIFDYSIDSFIIEPKILNIDYNHVYNIFCSYNYSVIVTDTGLWIVGYYYSLINYGDEPIKLKFDENHVITNMECCRDFIVILTSDNEIYLNYDKKKFILIDLNIIEPIICQVNPYIFILGKNEEGETITKMIGLLNGNILCVREITFDVNNVTKIMGSIGINKNIFVITDDVVYCRGNNYYGALGCEQKICDDVDFWSEFSDSVGKINHLRQHDFLTRMNSLSKKLFKNNYFIKSAKY